MRLKHRLGLSISCALCLATFAVPPAAAKTPEVALQAVPSATNVEIQVQNPLDTSEEGQSPALASLAKSAVIMDFATGSVLFEKNPHQRLPLASVTKIMTLLPMPSGHKITYLCLFI